ncbi:MAG: restriction endonuclease subunit S [Desulfovibrio sp.]|nr:restriction endonuclease subunit S [Desulfovibrio sp.]
MNIETVKNSILRLAVQGKLVPQNPDDEPAAKLLEKIRAERAKLIKDGKIKKPKTSSQIFRRDGSWFEKIGSEEKCIDDELPFEIPESWEWVRLGEIGVVERGGSPRPIQNFLTASPDGINWIKIGDTAKSGKYITQTKEQIIQEGVKYSRLVHTGDLLLSNSMSYGRPYILRIDGCIHDGWIVITNYNIGVDIDYFFYLLSSDTIFRQFSEKAGGSVVKNLYIDKVKNTLIPLPPLAEQARIAEKISQFMALAEDLDRALKPA